MIATVYGERMTFCGDGCRDSFREDRRARLTIYPPVALDNGSIVSWPSASLRLGFCAYCGTPVRGEV